MYLPEIRRVSGYAPMPNEMGDPTKPSLDQESGMAQNFPAEGMPQYEHSKRRNEDSGDKLPSPKRRKEGRGAGEHSNKRHDMGRSQYLYDYLTVCFCR